MSFQRCDAIARDPGVSSTFRLDPHPANDALPLNTPSFGMSPVGPGLRSNGKVLHGVAGVPGIGRDPTWLNLVRWSVGLDGVDRGGEVLG